MAVTVTNKLDHKGASGALASVTPTSGKRLLVCCGLMIQGGGDPSGAVAISDTQGRTWTSIGSVGGGDWGIGQRAFIASAGTGTATSITLTCPGFTTYHWEATVLELDGESGTIAGVVTDSAMATDGAASVTLAATPATGDLTIFTRYCDTGTNDGAPHIAATGWTIVSDQSDSDSNTGGALSVISRGSSTSTTVSVTDVWTHSQWNWKTHGIAFIIREASGGTNNAGIAQVGTGSASHAVGLSQAQNAAVSESGTGAATESLTASQSQAVQLPQVATGSSFIAGVVLQLQNISGGQVATGAASQSIVSGQSQTLTAAQNATGQVIESLTAQQELPQYYAEISQSSSGAASSSIGVSQEQTATLSTVATGSASQSCLVQMDQVANASETSTGSTSQVVSVVQLQIAVLTESSSGSASSALSCVTEQGVSVGEQASGSASEYVIAIQTQNASASQSGSGAALQSLAADSDNPFAANLSQAATGSAIESLTATIDPTIYIRETVSFATHWS